MKVGSLPEAPEALAEVGSFRDFFEPDLDEADAMTYLVRIPGKSEMVSRNLKIHDHDS